MRKYPNLEIGLPAEIKRNKEAVEKLPKDHAAIAVTKREIEQAEQAMADKDVIRMSRCFNLLVTNFPEKK